jgi:hypothetical protein
VCPETSSNPGPRKNNPAIVRRAELSVDGQAQYVAVEARALLSACLGSLPLRYSHGPDAWSASGTRTKLLAAVGRECHSGRGGICPLRLRRTLAYGHAASSC